MQKYIKKEVSQKKYLKENTTTEIPLTRLISYHEFNKERKTSIMEYLPLFLSYFQEGMTCREISNHTSIWVQSLTNPLKTLVNDGRLEIRGVKRSLDTNRLNLIYGVKEDANG